MRIGFLPPLLLHRVWCNGLRTAAKEINQTWSGRCEAKLVNRLCGANLDYILIILNYREEYKLINIGIAPIETEHV